MHSRMPLGAALLAGLAVAALSGCTGGDTDPEASEVEYVVEDAAAEATRGVDAVSPDLPDPCELLDAATLEALVGSAFADGTYNGFLSSEDESICEWYGSGDSYASVQLAVRTYSGSTDEEVARATSVYGELAQIAVDGADYAVAVSDGTIVGALVSGTAIYVLYYTEEWTDLTDSTASVAAAALGSLGS